MSVQAKLAREGLSKTSFSNDEMGTVKICKKTTHRTRAMKFVFRRGISVLMPLHYVFTRVF